MVLFILAVLWAGVGLSWLRSRTENRSVNSISSFSNHLTVLARTSPARQGLDVVEDRSTNRLGGLPTLHRSTYLRRPQPVMTLAQARRRRRDVLFGLMGGSALFLLLAVLLGGVFVVLGLVSLALLGTYIALLVRAQRIAEERRAKVRYLPQMPTISSGEPALLFESAN